MLRLSFQQKLFITLAVLGGGTVVSYVIGGVTLAVIFMLLAFDKIILGLTGMLRRIGIEITTILTIFLGLLHGPVFAFFFTLLLVPFFHAIKFFFVPLQPDWPLFVPAPYNVADAAGAAVAALLKDLAVTHIMLVVILVKIILYAVADRFMYEKPVDVVGAVTYFAFNMLIVGSFAAFLVGVTNAPVKL